ncbi:uncharacterized protein LOC110685685 [Chenopodium quinoa]|uniref:uncharacterized protein LOC110685685 n=1 Tax=Chenopodium quinoa TaxID=63459 RepID=UPI000B797698|nr:uncharacterized protein LOC110685685 [Chenopodium quinoa]
MVDNVDTTRDHVVCHGFRPQYHVWVWHGEKGSYRENVVGNDTHDKSVEIRAEDEYGTDDGGDGDEDRDEIEDGGGDHLDEMMHNVEGEFGDRCDVFESLSEAAKNPLYPGSKKYTKLSAVYKNKGHKAYPICIDDTPNVYLEHYGKDVYVRTRRLLRRDHPYRRQKKAFNGKVEEGAAPRPLSGQEVYGRVKGIPTVFEKNVCDAVVGTIMGIHGKTMDGKSARLDLEAWGGSSGIVGPVKGREGKGNGKVFMRWCYPFERHMGTLQHKVRNPAHPEGSMIQGIVAEEIGNFVAEYVAVAEPIGLPTSRHEGRLDGHDTLGSKRFLQAHLFVLHHVAEVHPYLDEHMDSLRAEFPSKRERVLMQLHNKMFVTWFHDRVMRQLDKSVSDTIKWLAYGPKEDVYSFEGYDIMGIHSGLSIVIRSPHRLKIVVSLLWLHQESLQVQRIQHRCNVRHDDFTLVDLGHLRDSLELFILASQAKQVFYVTDLADPKWSIVLASKRRILGVGDVEDEEEYDAFDDSPPFTAPRLDVANDVDKDANYVRSDHNEGILE